MKPNRPLPLAAIDPARCTGCGWCVAACPLNLLHLQLSHWKKTSALEQPERCNGCSQCALRCPFNAITMVPRKEN